MPIYEWKCWIPQSQLQIKLILVLIVAIPYLLALIGVVAYYGSTRNYENNSDKTTKVPKGKIRNIDIDETENFRNLPLLDEEDSIFLRRDVYRRQGGNKYEFTQDKKNCACPETEICPVYEETSKYPFISAITEIIYKDAPGEYRLKCVATNLNALNVITSSECFSNNRRRYAYFQIKAGSDSWATEKSSHHTILQVTERTVERKALSYYQGPNTAVVELNEEIPRLPTVSFALISNYTFIRLINKTVQAYLWKSSFIDPLQDRNKNERLTKLNFKMHTCKHCKARDVLCTIIHSPTCSNFFFTSGIPLFFKSRLIGIQVSSYCDQKNKKKELCFEGILLKTPSKRRRLDQNVIRKLNRKNEILKKLTTQLEQNTQLITNKYDGTANISNKKPIKLFNKSLLKKIIEELQRSSTSPRISMSSNSYIFSNVGTNTLPENKYYLIKDSTRSSLSSSNIVWPNIENLEINKKIKENSSILYELFPFIKSEINNLPETQKNNALSLYEMFPDMMATDYLSS